MIETLPFERMFASAVEQKASSYEKGRVNTPPTIVANLGNQKQAVTSDLISESLLVCQEQQQQQQ